MLDLPVSRDYVPGVFLQHGLAPRIHLRAQSSEQAQSFEMVRGPVAQGHGVALLNLFPPDGTGFAAS